MTNLDVNEPNPIMNLDDQSYMDNGTCPKCGFVGLEMEENCTGVEFFHVFTGKYWVKKVDETNWYGDTNCVYKCPKCKWTDENE